MKRWSRSEIALFAVLALAVAGAHGSPPGAAAAGAPPEVKIGLPIPLSGAGASIGQRFQKAAALAIEDLNRMAAGKMKFVSATADSQCDPKGGTTAAMKLILQDQVQALVGELCSDATLVIKDLAGQNKVPLVVPDSSALNITEQGNPYTFRVIPNEVQQHIALARVAIRHFHFKKFVVAYEQTSSGSGAGKAFIAEAKKLGGQIVGEIPLDRNTPDFTPVVTKIKGDNPDAMNLTMLLDPSVRFFKALHEQGVTKPVLNSIWWAYPLFEHLAGPAAEGTIRELFYISSSKIPAAMEFTRAFTAKYPGEDPDFNHAQFYAAVRLAGEVALKYGPSREDIRRGLAATKNYPSPIGALTFDGKGQVIPTLESITFIQSKGGKAIILDNEPGFDKKGILGL